MYQINMAVPFCNCVLRGIVAFSISASTMIACMDRGDTPLAVRKLPAVSFTNFRRLAPQREADGQGQYLCSVWDAAHR
jgi:hypothetical protein